MAKPNKDANSIRRLLDFILGWYEKGSGSWILASRVERVLTLHRDGPEYGDSSGWCTACGDCWPCATVRALEGEE